jgi:hypothetical protein
MSPSRAVSSRRRPSWTGYGAAAIPALLPAGAKEGLDIAPTYPQAGQAGAPSNPDWYHDLLAHPG